MNRWVTTTPLRKINLEEEVGGPPPGEQISLPSWDYLYKAIAFSNFGGKCCHTFEIQGIIPVNVTKGFISVRPTKQGKDTDIGGKGLFPAIISE